MNNNLFEQEKTLVKKLRGMSILTDAMDYLDGELLNAARTQENAVLSDIKKQIVFNMQDYFALQEETARLYKQRDGIVLGESGLNKVKRIVEEWEKRGLPIVEDNGEDLPEGLRSNERFVKYLNKAIQEGYIKQDSYEWVFKKGNKTALAYFCEKIFCPDNTGKMPESALNELFGVKRLASALTQFHNAKHTQKWRKDIDKLFQE